MKFDTSKYLVSTMSMQVPRPDTLVEKTAAALRAAIGERRLGPSLPGEPRLAHELGVSRRTLRSALEILTSEGLISQAGRGTARMVLATPDARNHNASAPVIGVILPRPIDELSPGTQDLMRDLAEALSPEHAEFVYHHSSVAHLSKPEKHLQAVVDERRVDLWLLYEASLPVAHFFEISQIPAVVCGGPAFNSTLPYCAFDGMATLRHAIGVLSRAGHTRIIAPLRYDRPSRVEALRDELKKRHIDFIEEYHCPVWNNDPNTLRQLLRRLFDLSHRPTAIILNGLDALIVLYSTLLEKGLTVPNDISIIVSGSDPTFEHFSPRLNHYTTPHKKLAQVLAKMIRAILRGQAPKNRQEVLLMDYLKGESVKTIN